MDHKKDVISTTLRLFNPATVSFLILLLGWFIHEIVADLIMKITTSLEGVHLP
jgi:hypothetical protein